MPDEKPIRLYRPSSGSEGAYFQEQFCCHCARDAAMNGSKVFDDCRDDDLCQIIADTYAYDIGEPQYPREWIEDEEGPRCTAFVPFCHDIPRPRCDKTLDLFEAAHAG